MDSMRHLSTSLPQTSRRRNDHDLLSSFKAAALSVTNLYKAAASDSAQSRESGYQDALDDLLAFLDKEAIGMGDGEGWRVRKWVLERLEDAPKAAGSDEEEDRHEESETRCSSPEAQKKSSQQASSDPAERRTSSEPPQAQAVPAPILLPTLEDFTFRSATQYPAGHDRDIAASMDLDSTVAPRPTRPRHRAKKDGRNGNINLASSTGKRKFPYGDFFDIGNINFDTDKRESGRGGKRGRFV